MCFSPSASFTASAALLIASGYALNRTRASGEKTFLPIAFTPFLFAVQQFIEGLIWLCLQDKMTIESSTLEALSLVYLFFAYAFWPLWVPLAVAIFDQKRRILLLCIGVVGLIFFITTIVHFCLHPEILDTKIMNHSICYLHACAYKFSWPVILYIALTCGSMIVASWIHVNILGLITLVAAVLTFLIYNHTFASVWCFFSAIISIYIAFMAYKLEKKSD